MVWFRRAPSTATLLSVIAEITKAMNTPRMHSVWEMRRPNRKPPNKKPKMPASTAPAKGASGTASSVDALRVWLMFLLAFELVQFFDLDARLVAEQQHQDRQPDRRFGGRDGEDEEHEDLAVHVAEVVREGDEVHVDGQQHQLDRHQQDDQVAPVHEDADHRQREQHRAERQEVSEGERHALVSTRAATVGGTC